MRTGRATLRCAIYTRKSTEEGLDQSFNSLHAQREACEAYVLSQAGEGWIASAQPYDDGGYSGGNLNRPGLQRMLEDVEGRRIDVVVVYKVDRLTRSLADFAKIVETFDKAGVSFVSVTQAFNTTNSMGRLTLNVLLSFAQFEREVTGERIRDKIAASKAKGMWMGGVPPLGYTAPTDPQTRHLVVDEDEAARVRMLFERYLELGSVHALVRWAEQVGLRSKRWITRSGAPKGGATLRRGALLHLLRNRVYLGEIVHKAGAGVLAHPPIVSEDLFNAVQTRLPAARRAMRGRFSTTHLLAGLAYDEKDRLLSPVSTRTRGKPYRYYVSGGLMRGGRTSDDPTQLRIAAEPLERLVTGRVSAVTEAAEPVAHLRRVTIRPDQVEILLDLECVDRSRVEEIRAGLAPGEGLHEQGPHWRLELPCTFRRSRGRTVVYEPAGGRASTTRYDPVLIDALRRAHELARQYRLRPCDEKRPDFALKAPASPYDVRLLRLSFLAPAVQTAILEGRQPSDCTVESLMADEFPLDWCLQRSALGV